MTTQTMGYGKQIYQKACAELERKKLIAETDAQQNLENFYKICPQALEIEKEKAMYASSVARAIISGGDVKSKIKSLKEKSLNVQKEFNTLLIENRFTKKQITPQYHCKKCADTGFIDGKMCRCLSDLQRKLAYEKLSLSVPLKNCTFEKFSLDFYAENKTAMKQMRSILSYCKGYADKFSSTSPSLLFNGGNGLGKTHISLAIAQAAIEKGFGVIYGATQNFATAFEKERFDKIDNDNFGDTNSQLISCDLLIIDDLGTEFNSSYVNSAIYNIINTRLMAEKPTIISTNLNLKQLEERYGGALVSRINGSYGIFNFLGNDIRNEKRWKS